MFGRPFPSKEKQEAMCGLYQSGCLLASVAETSGYSVSTVRKVLALNGIKSRHRGARKGTGKIELLDDSLLRAFKRQWDCLDSTVKGTICENYVKTRLAEVGFDVWEPSVQNHRTDLVVLTQNTLKRIQVKAGTYDVKTKCFRANFSRHRRGGKRSDYNPEDVDFFAVFCAGLPEINIYLIPATQVKNRSPRLFPHRQRILSYAGKPTLEKYLNAFEALK